MRVILREDPEVRYEGYVSSAGSIPIPYLGEFYIGGLTQEDAAKSLAAALTKSLYQTANVTVILVRKAPGKVYVYGAVKKPGVVLLPEIGSLTILQLISQVDGLTAWAAPEDAYIIRRRGAKDTPERIAVDLTKTLRSFAQETDLRLEPDDALFVPAVNGNSAEVMTSQVCEIIIVGEVGKTGIVTFEPGEQRTLMRAIFKAGGFSKFAKGKAVRLIRSVRTLFFP